MKQKNCLTKENVYQQASQFSLSALEIAERNTIDQFKPEIFKLLKQYVYFDAGQWMTRAVLDADNKRLHPSGAYLQSLNSNKLTDYQLYINQDQLVSAVVESPNITHDLKKVWPDKDYFNSNVYLEYGKKYGLERALSTLVYREHNNFCQIVSLYRKQRINLFTEYERIFVELTCQYMSSALRLNILKNVAGDISQPKLKPKAVTDADGFIFEADANFLNWLQQYYPDFDGRYLPLSLLHKANTGELINQDLFSLSVNQVGDLFLISRVSSLDIHKLSAKESNIVISLAKGGSNKSIAREFNNSKTTIDTHLRNIYDKLGFSKSMDNHEKRRQLILMASESVQPDNELNTTDNSFVTAQLPPSDIDTVGKMQHQQKVSINIEKRLLTINDQAIALPPKEFAILLWIIDKEEINLNEINKNDIRHFLKIYIESGKQNSESFAEQAYMNQLKIPYKRHEYIRQGISKINNTIKKLPPNARQYLIVNYKKYSEATYSLPSVKEIKNGADKNNNKLTVFLEEYHQVNLPDTIEEDIINNPSL